MDEELAKLVESSVFINNDEVADSEDDDDDDDDRTLSDPSEERDDPEDPESQGACGGPHIAEREGASFASLYESPGEAVVSAPVALASGPSDSVTARRDEDRRASIPSTEVRKKRSRRFRRRHSNDQDQSHNVICNKAEVQGLFVGSSETGTCKNCGHFVRVVGNYVSHVQDSSHGQEPGPERLSPIHREPTPSPTKRRALRNYRDGRGPSESPPLTSEETAAVFISSNRGRYGNKDRGQISLQGASGVAEISSGDAGSPVTYQPLVGAMGASPTTWGATSRSRGDEGFRFHELGTRRRFSEPTRVNPRSEHPPRGARGSLSGAKKKSKKHKQRDGD